jgi:5'-nucleotidase
MDGGLFQGLGGVARRAALINRVRQQNPNVLLLDSGDIFQGTPYFNFFKGEIEFEAMSAMKYDVATIGNHDFDNGVEGLVEMMPRATFQFVSANYDVSGSALEPFVEPWTIREMGGVRIGIFGLGIALKGLVLEKLHKGVRYTDPLAAARRCVSELKSKGCSLIVCLSHLGYRYRGGTVSDTLLAQEVEGVDLVLGGHTHTFLDEPDVYAKPHGRMTLVNQVGWAGMRLGRVDVTMAPIEGSVPSGSGATDAAAQHHRPAGWASEAYPVDSALD